MKIPGDVKAEMGRQLSAMYRDVISEGVPSDFPKFSVGWMRAALRLKPRQIRKTLMARADNSVRDVMLAAVPSLRAFAVSLCGNVDRADDLVQETLLRALANLNSFTPGTNMSAWLFTILRNHFRSNYRKRRREVEDPDGSYEEALISPPDQIRHIEICELRNALDLLPFEQRESLILVAASGFSYEEAAQICGCAVGTVKSRVNRARNRLAEILSVESSEDFGPDQETRAIIGSAVFGWRRR